MAGDEQPQNDGATVQFDPDDMGTGTVAQNGMVYVGREYAGEDVKWVIERAED